MHFAKKAAVVTAAACALVAGSAAGASADSVARGATVGSGGILSGNLLQIPIDIPINVCGNTVGGVLSPAFGNVCINAEGERRHERVSRFVFIEREHKRCKHERHEGCGHKEGREEHED